MESLINRARGVSVMKRKLTFGRSLSILRRHQQKKRWAEGVGDALASRNLKRLRTQYAEWKLSGKRGSITDFLREVPRTHKKASLGIDRLLKEAERQNRAARLRKRL
jgi:hypothetical protein